MHLKFLQIPQSPHTTIHCCCFTTAVWSLMHRQQILYTLSDRSYNFNVQQTAIVKDVRLKNKILS